MAHGYRAIGLSNGQIVPNHSASGNLYGSSPVSFEQWANSQGIEGNPYNFWNRIGNFFTGNVSSAQQSYQNYLSDYEFRKNQEVTAKANQETWAREDTEIQRLMEQYQKAGLNPYMIVNSGGITSGTSSQAQRTQYKKDALKDGKIESKMLNTAVKILALILLKKAL